MVADRLDPGLLDHPLDDNYRSLPGPLAESLKGDKEEVVAVILVIDHALQAHANAAGLARTLQG